MEVIPAADLVNFKNQILDFYQQLELIVNYPNNHLDFDYDLFEFEIRAFLSAIYHYALNEFDFYERHIINLLKTLIYGDVPLKKKIKFKVFKRKVLKTFTQKELKISKYLLKPQNV